jgi:rhodanese-related sulfurtransferase
MGAFDQVDEAEQEVERVSLERAEREHAGGEAVFVDIRDVRERWIKGTIPGAKHAPRGMLEFWADTDPESEYARDYFRLDQRLVLYCKGGARSALAARTLQEMGYERVAHLEGGFDAWAAAGNDVDDVPQKDYKNRADGE